MDRNQATGLILIALLLILYFQFFAPEPPEPQESPEVTTTQPLEESPQIPAIPDSIPTQKDSLDRVSQFGTLADRAMGTAKEITVENERMKIVFSSHGGKVQLVELKDFVTDSKEPLLLVEKGRSKQTLLCNYQGKPVNLYELYYDQSQSKKADTTLITYTLPVGAKGIIQHIYSIPPDGYTVGYQLKINGLESDINSDQLQYEWYARIKLQEKDVSISRINSTVNYYTVTSGFDRIAERSTDLEEEQIGEPLKWVSIKQKFFNKAIIAENAFVNGRVSTTVDLLDETTVKVANIGLTIPLADVQAGKGQFTYFFGPNDYKILKRVTEDFSKNLSLGWPPMIWVNKFVIIPLFDLLNNFIGNYGIIIIVMVLMIKLVLSPLSYKSYLSMAKMKVLKPEMDEIKEKYGDDMAKAQQEQMKLFQQVGVNPVSGCIPLLLQMPILLAMFYFFPQSIELRQKPFLWADDLSSYDAIVSWDVQIPLISSFYGNHISLFVLLMTVSTILYTWSNQQVSTVQGPMKAMTYMMPVIFMFVLNSYPAALSFYYFVANLVTFGQQALIRKFVDEDKIRKILDENKKRNRNKKKSKFQLKLEEAMKASEKAKRNKTK